jgi:hypothetical protein
MLVFKILKEFFNKKKPQILKRDLVGKKKKNDKFQMTLAFILIMRNLGHQ